MKLGEVATEIRDRINSSQISIEQYVTTENMVKDRGGVVVADSMPNDAGLVRYRIGDVLIANIRPYLKKIWLSNCEGGCSSDVVVYRASTSELSSEYLHSALSSDDFFDYVMRKTRGTKMPRGDRDWMLQFELPLPPLAVQHEIVARLEKELAAVEQMAKGFEALKTEADQLFKSTLKETFEEVSRGGAETRRLGDLCETGAGGTPLKQHKEYYESGTIPWLRSGEVCTRDIHSTELCITQLGVDNSSAKLFPANSVVVAMYGATAGQVGILRMASTTNQAVCAIFPAGFYEPEYLYYQLVDKKADMVAQAQGGAQPNISQIKIRNLEVCFPSLPAQRKIVAKLDVVRERCEKLKRAAEEGLQTAALMRKAILREAFA